MSTKDNTSIIYDVFDSKSLTLGLICNFISIVLMLLMIILHFVSYFFGFDGIILNYLFYNDNLIINRMTDISVLLLFANIIYILPTLALIAGLYNFIKAHFIIHEVNRFSKKEGKIIPIIDTRTASTTLKTATFNMYSFDKICDRCDIFKVEECIDNSIKLKFNRRIVDKIYGIMLLVMFMSFAFHHTHFNIYSSEIKRVYNKILTAANLPKEESYIKAGIKGNDVLLILSYLKSNNNDKVSFSLKENIFFVVKKDNNLNIVLDKIQIHSKTKN